MTTSAVKSKKLKFYDVDRGCARVRTFSKLENVRIREIFGKVEETLIRDRYDIRGKYISVGKYRCELHMVIIELDSTIYIADIS